MSQIAGLQLDIRWEDPEANFERVREILSRDPLEPGTLLALPEMFSTGFSLNLEEIAGGAEVRRFLTDLAREMRVYVLGGLVTRAADDRGRNQAALFNPRGEEMLCYQKIHPFTYGGETAYFEPGREVLTFRWAGLVASPFICYDLRFPEIFREAVRRGAELLVVIANWPAPRESHWITLLQARAIENQAYVLGVNRCGNDPKTEYSGRSLIVDPRGQVLADGGSDERILRANIDHQALLEYRERFPALQDARW